MPAPRILLTNDDGVRAPGLRALADALAPLGEVTVVAPDRERSGASQALTISAPLRLERLEPGVWQVDGTPTDCVNLAFFEVFEDKPDLVVSGINRGHNLGDDVLYSGTVAAALEGLMLGSRALAVSADPTAESGALDEAAALARRIAGKMLDEPMTAPVVLNLNVPLETRGLRIARQGRRLEGKGLVRRDDPKGRSYFWIGLVPGAWSPDVEADHHALAEGYATLTPLQPDLTALHALEELSGWSRALLDGAGHKEKGSRGKRSSGDPERRQ